MHIRRINIKKQGVLTALAVLSVIPSAFAQADTMTIKEAGKKSAIDSTLEAKAIPVPRAPSVIDSNDDNNFLEMYYYGPDLDGGYDVYDPWDIYPDREGDSQEREADDRDGQQQDARE